jgi:hypothetical protein
VNALFLRKSGAASRVLQSSFAGGGGAPGQPERGASQSAIRSQVRVAAPTPAIRLTCPPLMTISSFVAAASQAHDIG